MRPTARSLLFWLCLAGCSSDAPPDRHVADGGAAGRPDGTSAAPGGSAAPDAAPRVRGTVKATVRCAGTKLGPLGVGAFASSPPMGPPLAYGRVAAPMFPATVTLEGLAPGAAVYVIATLDVAPGSPSVPGPEDPTAASPRIQVPAAGGEITLDVELTDR